MFVKESVSRAHAFCLLGWCYGDPLAGLLHAPLAPEMACPVCPGNEQRGRQGGGLARAAGPTPCYLKPAAYKGERACSVEGWGWGRDVGAGVPRSRAGWCQVPGSACGSPAGAFCHPSCLTPFIIPPAWAPKLTWNILPSLSIPLCSPPEQNVLEQGSHAQPHLNPASPLPQTSQGARAHVHGSLPYWLCPFPHPLPLPGCLAGSRGPIQPPLLPAALLGLEHSHPGCQLGWVSLSQPGAMCN